MKLDGLSYEPIMIFNEFLQPIVVALERIKNDVGNNCIHDSLNTILTTNKKVISGTLEYH